MKGHKVYLKMGKYSSHIKNCMMYKVENQFLTDVCLGVYGHHCFPPVWQRLVLSLSFNSNKMVMPRVINNTNGTRKKESGPFDSQLFIFTIK